MVEKVDRSRVGDYPRGKNEQAWEVFVRDDDDAAMRHVGSVAAPDHSVAYEQATRLFGWYATELWLCPAAEMHRYTTHDLDDDATPRPIETEDESRTVE